MSGNPLYFIRQEEPGVSWELEDLERWYHCYEGLFSFKIHHGGLFTSKPGMKYEGGKIDHADCLNIDLFSVHEMDSIMEDLGYTGKQVMLYFFLKPGYDLDNGLLPLSSDQDVHKLSEYVDANKLIYVYIEHGKSNLVGYYSPMKVNKLTIEEIDDDEVVPSKPKKPKPSEKRQTKSGFRKLLLDPVFTQSSEQNVRNDNVDPVDTHTSHMDLGNDNVGPVFDDVIGENFVNDNVDSQFDHASQENVENDNVGPVFDDGSDEHSDDSSDGDSSGDDSQDSDYLVDEENEIEEVEVDMRDFNLHIDQDVEYMGCNEPMVGNLGVGEDDEIDIINNEEFDSGSDAEDNVSRLRNRLLKRLKKKKPSVDGGIYNTVFYPGQTFGNSTEVKDLVKRHAIETRRELKFVKNGLTRVRVLCEGKIPVFDPTGGSEAQHSTGPKATGPSRSTRSSETVHADTSGVLGGKSKLNKGGRGHKASTYAFTCPWTSHVSKIRDCATWMVKTYIDEHKCLQSRTIKHCTSKFLGKSILQQIEGNPDIPARALEGELQRKFELGMSTQKAQRAKKLAKGELKGDYTKQYNMLRDYIQELQSSNPDTTVRLEVERPQHEDQETRVFQRIYICLGALKRGFKSAGREMLGLDGAFISGPFPGQVLTAVSLDSNNSIYHVAYAIVEAENLHSWTWFLECLGDDLDLDVRSNYTFISDRQKGLIPALSKVFPCAEHRFCLRHIHENMELQWRGAAFKNHLWKCATKTIVQEFTKSMLEFKRYNEAAHNWLSKIPPQHWAISHFSGRAKSDVLLNNMCEVLNSKTVKARDRPIVHCLEYIREYLMVRIVNVGKVISRCEGPLTPTATRLLELAKTEANGFTAIFNGEDKYQVSGPWGDQCVVDVRKMVCSCRRWEITGIPCKHAVCANWNMATNNIQVGLVETWVDPIYRLDTWKLMYQFKITPINGVNMWSKSSIPSVIIPPKYHKPIGRPRKKRRKNEEEIQMVNKGKLSRKFKPVYCKNCGSQGHNKRSCKGGSTQPTQASQTGASGPSASQNAPMARETAQRSTQFAPCASQNAPMSRQTAPRSTQTAPSASQTGTSGPRSAQNDPMPVTPNYRTGGVVKSPGGKKWVRFRGTSRPS